MSGLEIAALAALGVGYIDAKYRVRDDLKTMGAFGSALITFASRVRNNKINVWYILEDWAKAQPNAMFLIYPEPKLGEKVTPGENLDHLFHVRSYTYGEVYDIVLKYSSYLSKEHGVKRGDVVALDFVNKPEFIFCWFALWQLGATPALINYNLQENALRHCVLAAQAKLLIADGEVRSAVDTVAAELNKSGVTIVHADAAHFKHVLSTYQPYKITPDQRGYPEIADAACYIFTSGTTGLPKAANMSWKKWNFGSMLYAKINFLTKKDIIFSAMPLYHSTAATLGLMASMHIGAAYGIGHKFSVTTFWTQAKLSHATGVQYVGETCRYLLNGPPSVDEKVHGVRMALGNGLRPDIWRQFKERFNIPRINEFYGATELPMAINNVQDGEFGIGSCGSFGTLVLKFLRKNRFDIARVDPDTQDLYRNKNGLCERVNWNEPGEMLFKIDAKDTHADFQGYLGNDKATNEKLLFDVFSKGDAWVRTGDLLRLTEDGHYYFVDRMGDTFRWKSENVSTNEVEEAMTENPQVGESVVVGVKVPNHEGRAGFAVIQPKVPGQIPDPSALAKLLLRRLPRYAVPVFIKFVEEIPLTGNNKIQKKAYRDQKIPSESETIYWLQGDSYVPLTKEAWAIVETGKVKL